MVAAINPFKYFLIIASIASVSATPCGLSFVDGQKLYNFSLVSPLPPKYPHGIRSEDGFYKVAENKTMLWFQLCDGMVFNHDLPRCAHCSIGIRLGDSILRLSSSCFAGNKLDCGGGSVCGSECSALVANNIGGYDVCTNIGRLSSTTIHVIDDANPYKGVMIKMLNVGSKNNCSLSVSVLCDLKGANGPHSLEKTGTCDYAAVLQHPSGCAAIIYVHGKGLGWFGTLTIIIVCLFGGYLLAGTVYRYFFLGVRGLEIIPNLDFWARIPQRIQSFFASLARRFRGPTEGYRSTYSPVNF